MLANDDLQTKWRKLKADHNQTIQLTTTALITTKFAMKWLNHLFIEYKMGCV
jgi:hypothetical protein